MYSLHCFAHEAPKKALNTEIINNLIATMNNDLATLTAELEAFHAIECSVSTEESQASPEKTLTLVSPLSPHTPAWITTLITISENLIFYTDNKNNYFVGSIIYPEAPIFKVMQGDHDLSIIYNKQTSTWQLWGYNQAHTIFTRENEQDLTLECNSEECQKLLTLQTMLNASS